MKEHSKLDNVMHIALEPLRVGGGFLRCWPVSVPLGLIFLVINFALIFIAKKMGYKFNIPWAVLIEAGIWYLLALVAFWQFHKVR